MKKLFALISLLGLVLGMGGALNAQEASGDAQSKLDTIVLYGDLPKDGNSHTVSFKFSATPGEKFVIKWDSYLLKADTILVENANETEKTHTYSKEFSNSKPHFDIVCHALTPNGHFKSLRIDSTYKYTQLVCKNCILLDTVQVTHNDLVEIAFRNCPALTFWDCSYNKIGSLYFWPDSNWYDNLAYLNCSHNDIRVFTATDCIALETLDCSNNPELWTLDTDDCKALKSLDCSNTLLRELYLPTQSILQTLDCRNTQLASLSLSELPALRTLDCSDNPQLTQLTIQCPSLDALRMHGNTQLTSLHVSYSRLADLDLSSNTQLTSLELFELPTLQTLNCGNTQLTHLFISELPALQTLNCNNQQLTSLELSELPALQTLNCSNTQLLYLFMSKLPHLQVFNCNNTQLTSLELPELPALQTLDCSNTQLTSLSLSELPALRTLNCSNNPYLTSLTIQCPSLDSLRMHGNTQLTSLYVSYSRLTALDLSSNTQLTSLGLSELPALLTLNCNNTQLTYLPLSNLPALQTLDCSNTQLTHLYLNLPALQTLTCRNTQLTTLSLSELPALRTLDCSDNSQLRDLGIQCPNLDSLCMHGNTQLTSFDVTYSRLTALNLSGNTQLTSLDCHHNQLSSLDVTDCHNLQFINCPNNHLSFIDLPKEFAGFIACDSNHIPLSVLASLLKQCENATFDPQLIALPSLPIGQTLDLRNEMQGSDYNVEYTVYIDNTEVDNRFYTIRNGLFAFRKAGNYRVKLSSVLPLGMSTLAMPGSVYYDLTVVDSIARPTFSVPSGKVKRGTDVALITTTSDARILYTIDGSTPDTKDALEYASPICINSPMTIKAITVCDTVISQVAIATYTIDSVANENDLRVSNLRVYAKDRTIYLSEEVGEVDVFTMDGHCVYRGFDTAIPVEQSGIYIVSATGRRWKVAVR